MIVKKFMCLVHHWPASRNCDLRRSKEEAGVWVRWHPGFEVLGLGFWVLVRIEAVWVWRVQGLLAGCGVSFQVWSLFLSGAGLKP